MNWWHTPYARVDIANGGLVELIMLSLMWLGAAFILGMGVWRRYGVRFRYHSVIKLTAVFGIIIGLILGFAAGYFLG